MLNFCETNLICEFAFRFFTSQGFNAYVVDCDNLIKHYKSFF